jgi:hypothetical protein
MNGRVSITAALRAEEIWSLARVVFETSNLREKMCS